MFRDTFAFELLNKGVPIDRMTEKHYSPFVEGRPGVLTPRTTSDRARTGIRRLAQRHLAGLLPTTLR